MRRMNGGGVRPLIGIAAMVGALILPLSGCGVGEPETNISQPKESEQDQNAPQPEDDATPTSGDTSAPEMPPLPPAAEEKTDDGAAAFAEYYIDLWRRSVQADSYEVIEQYTSADCGISCKPMRGPSPGRYIQGGELEILESEGFEQRGANRWGASVTFTIKAGTWVPHTPNADSEEHELQDSIANMRLENREGTWEVLHIEFNV